VGSPNVGKSVVFAELTGRYAPASNYPGTTVEVLRGSLAKSDVEVVDTPGMYSLYSVTEEERVARRILLTERPKVVVHVVDACNLDRMLPLTLQLLEAGLPVVVLVNMLDEAESAGLTIDLDRLGKQLGVPVVGGVAVTGRGMADLRSVVLQKLASQDATTPQPVIQYPAPLEKSVGELTDLLSADYSVSRRCLAVLLLQADDEIARLVYDTEPDETAHCIANKVAALTRTHTLPIEYELALARKDTVDRFLNQVIARSPVKALVEHM